MFPQRFAQANVVMRRPDDMTEEECADIHAYRDGKHVITAWRPSPEEMVRINLGEPIWLWVVGETTPPVALTVESPFETTKATDPNLA